MPGDEPSLWTKYVASFYWAITVLSPVGYGDICNYELGKVLFIAVQLLGCMVFGTLTGALASHNVNATRAGENRRRRWNGCKNTLTTTGSSRPPRAGQAHYPRFKFQQAIFDKKSCCKTCLLIFSGSCRAILGRTRKDCERFSLFKLHSRSDTPICETSSCVT